MCYLTLNKNYISKTQQIFLEYIGIEVGECGLNLELKPGNCLKVEVEEDKVIIHYSMVSEIFRGLALLKENIKIGDTVEQPRCFETLAAFCDCSRNAVLKVDTVKKYIMDIASLGYNQLYLYTEDTFEIPEYQYFGHLRGKYSANEIREIDAFAKEFGIELIPAIQTLAHLNAIFRWNEFSSINDVSDILLCDDEKTYNLIDRMIASLRSMYSTDKINIGMDEAHLLGLGKYLEKNGYHSKMDIFLRHITRVVRIVKKYGFKPMMWSDMFFKMATGKCTYEALDAIKFDDNVLDLIPDEVALTYWNYSPRTEEYYDSLIESHLAMKHKVIFAGGCRKWVGIAPNYTFSFNASRMALNSVCKYGIKDVIVTAWGDDGAEGAAYLTLPILTLYAEKCYTGTLEDDAINHRLCTLFGYSLEDFMLLEKPNILPENNKEISYGSNANKILLFNDPVLGLYDKHIPEGTNEYFAELTQNLKKLKDKNNKFNYLFETVHSLCDFLSVKSEIGNKLRKAYLKTDKEILSSLLNDLDILISKLDVFHSTFRKNWIRENKIFGFDVQDIRIGALRARLIYTKDIIEQYVKGEITEIPELEEQVLYMDCRSEDSESGLNICCNSWKKIATASVLTD